MTLSCSICSDCAVFLELSRMILVNLKFSGATLSFLQNFREAHGMKKVGHMTDIDTVQMSGVIKQFT